MFATLLFQMEEPSLLFILFVSGFFFPPVYNSGPPKVASNICVVVCCLKFLCMSSPMWISVVILEVGVASSVVTPILQMRNLKLGKLLLVQD